MVRITPREVHVNDPGLLDSVYPSSPLRKRDKDVDRNLDTANSVGGTASHDLHRARREVLNPFFSKKAILSLEDLLRSKTEQLCEQLSATLKHEGVVNLSDLYYALARE